MSGGTEESHCIGFFWTLRAKMVYKRVRLV